MCNLIRRYPLLLMNGFTFMPSLFSMSPLSVAKYLPRISSIGMSCTVAILPTLGS